MSHDALYNMHELHSQLQQVNRRGIPKSFISRLLSIPQIVVHLMPCLLQESLETLLKVMSNSITLHYDTVFNIGDFYLSTLTYRHSLFEGDPIIPCVFLIHSRRFHEDHQYFLEQVGKEVSLLKTKRVNVVTDREFRFEGIYPCGRHLFV